MQRSIQCKINLGAERANWYIVEPTHYRNYPWVSQRPHMTSQLQTCVHVWNIVYIYTYPHVYIYIYMYILVYSHTLTHIHIYIYIWIPTYQYPLVVRILHVLNMIRHPHAHTPVAPLKHSHPCSVEGLLLRRRPGSLQAQIQVCFVCQHAGVGGQCVCVCVLSMPRKCWNSKQQGGHKHKAVLNSVTWRQNEYQHHVFVCQHMNKPPE